MKKNTKKNTKEVDLVKIYRTTNARLGLRIAQAKMKGETITRAELIDRMEKAYKLPS